MKDQPHRRFLLAAVSIGLASLILPAASSAIAQNQEEEAKDFQPPELLYLTWQELELRDSQVEHFPIWKPDGTLLGDKAAQELRQKLKIFGVFHQYEGQHHPLLLIFKVDPRAESFSVMPTFIDDSGTPHYGGGSRGKPQHGLILSAVSPLRDKLLLWPEKGTLKIRYQLENSTVVKTLEGPPDGVIDIAQGVTWELNADYAWMTDPKTGQIKRVDNQLTGLLVTNPNEADPNIDYDVRIEVEGGKLLDSCVLKTARSNAVGRPSTLQVSELVDSPQQITKLFVVRQRHATKTLKEVPIKRELLFKALQKDDSDE